MRRRHIPENVLSGKRIAGFRPEVLAESAFLSVFTVALPLFQIPFVPKVRWIIIGCTSAMIFGLNFIGFQGNSICETIVCFLRYRKVLKNYSYRRVNNGATSYTEVVKDGRVTAISKNKGKVLVSKLVGK